ncbi:hypothetical protein BD626DRAFT_548079 [Schizophyllum amplum]|uniref:NAD(P)-binding protein n=1 Tax=Schizophyllum amplum TaxID=97359 RepID=A0A550CG09_9AGAR|nr:hypothetical protein BD626DRAFT_548079 [Auriculariopsis ampla]
MPSTVYLVTGANRGIGLGITSQLAARPDAIVFAGVRDLSRAAALDALVSAYPGRVHVLKIISADRKNNDEAAQEMKKIAGRLDVVNTNGPLVLFQATYELLRVSKSPKFIAVTSALACIAVGPELPMNQMAYGMSKAALNWVTRKLHHDNPDMTIFPINPGGVETDASREMLVHEPALAQLWEQYPLIQVDESARGILEQVDVATRETHGGQFVDYTGLGKWAW